MFREENKLKLTDLIDTDFLQDLQDTFSKVMNLACLTVDDDGPITEPSNFSDFCKLIRSNSLGIKKCFDCHTKWGKLAAEKKEPVIHTCNWGLTAFSVPVIVENKHIASVLGGQVLTQKIDKEEFKKHAETLGIDNETFLQALSKIEVVPIEKVQTAAHLLYIIANAISSIGNKNFELLKSTKKETFYKNIVEAIRSSLDIDKTKKAIVDIIGTTMHADRCFFMEYDKTSDKFLIVKDEYTASNKIPEYLGTDVNIDVPNFMSEIKKGKYLVVDNKKIFLDGLEQHYDIEKETIKREKVYSAYGFPLFYQNEFLGVLGIHYLTKEHTASQEEIELLQQITNQISIALYQAELYKKTLIQTQREELIKNITEKMRSTLNLDETLGFVCEEMAKIFNVQRATIVSFEKPDNYKQFSIRKEFKETPETPTFVQFENHEKVAGYWTINTKKLKKIIAFDDIKNSNAPEFFKKLYGQMGIKSIIGIPIKKGNTLWGNMILSDYKKTRHWSEEEKELLNTISNQVYIAIKQAELFEQEKIIAERETLLRRTIGILRSTLDSEEIKNIFAEIIRDYFDADRCLFDEYNKNTDKFLPFRIEKLKSDKVKSLAGVSTEKSFPEFLDRHRKGKNTIIRDVEKILSKEKLSKYKAIQSISKGDVKSDYGLLVKHKNQIMGIIIMHFTEKTRTLTRDEFNFLQVLIDQVGTALYQSEIFEHERITAERETILRKTTDILRSTLDVEEVKKLFLEIVGNYFEADRCIFDDYDKNKKEFLPFRVERLKNQKVKSLIGFSVEEKFPEFAQRLKKGKNIILRDVEKTTSQKNLSRFIALESLSQGDVKSDYGMLIKYKNEIMGILIMHFTEKKRALTKDEMGFLKILRDQAGIALYHAELYQEAQQKAKKEEFLRTITETIRSSLDIDETKQKIVTAIGKALHADRCFIAEYDKDSKKVLPVSNEYLSSKDIFSYRGKDVTSAAPDIIEILKKGENVVINNKEIFAKDYSKSFQNEKLAMEKYEDLSLFAFPLFYSGELIGGLTVSYINRNYEITKEEVQLLTTIADQIATAMHQAKLYKITQTQAQRESLLRNITEKIRSSLDVEETLSYICEETAKLFNVERSTIATYINPQKPKEILIKKEYKVRPKIRGIESLINYKKMAAFWGDNLIKSPTALAFDDIQTSDTPGYFKENYKALGIKSIAGVTIKKGDTAWGQLILSEYNSSRHWSEDDKNLLQTIADQIYIAINQAELFEQQKTMAEREKTLRQLNETIRRSLDINIVKQTIVTETAKIFNADQCYLVEFDEEKNVFVSPDEFSEYRANSELCSYVGYDFEGSDVQRLSKSHKELKTVYVEDVDEFIKSNKIEGSGEEAFIRKSGLKTAIGQAIFYQNIFVGVLSIYFIKEKRTLTADDFNFINDISIQVGGALYQSRLLQKTKETAERETIIRKIIETCRSSLGLKEVKEKITYELGKMFDADRCYFRAYDRINDKFLAPDVEYLSSPEIGSLINVVPDQKGLRYFIDEVNKQKRGFYPIVVNEEFAKNTPIENYFKDTGTKADYAIPLISRKDELLWLVLHYTKKDPKLSEEQKKLLETIAYQIDIAFEQIKLYNNAQKQAEREKSLSKIINVIRSSLDINKMKKQIATEIGKSFNVERCVIHQINQKTGKFEIIDEFSEYKELDNILSYVGIDIETPKLKFFKDLFSTKHEMIAPNWPEYLANLENVPQETKEWIKTLDIKSDYVFPIMFQDKLLATLYLTYTQKYETLSEDDLNDLRMLTNQVAIAIYQANLYNTTQLQAERELASSRIINAIRSTLDINEVKNKFVEETGKYFNASRCFIYEYGQGIKSGIYSEYTSSPEIKRMSEDDFEKPQYKYWEEAMFGSDLSTGTFAYDLEKYLKEAGMENTPVAEHMKEYSIKTAIGIPIFYAEQIYGSLIIQFTDKVTLLSEEDVDFIKSLANQAGIALHQAHLYEITQIQAEREKISRNIVEILRSSIDKNIIKKQFVKNIGKLFDADRVLLSEYDLENQIYLPADTSSEYLKNSSEKTLVGYDWTNTEVSELVQPLLEKRELNIYSWDEYIKQNPKSQDFINFFEEYKIKSSYNFPIIYQQSLMGFFCLDYINKPKILNDEDIGRLRSMSSQAGIALYHAKIFVQAQELASMRSACVIKFSTAINELLENTSMLTKELSRPETQCENCSLYLSYLNEIISRISTFIEDIKKHD